MFLLPFEMAVKLAGAGSVMNSYQEIDGEQPAASRWLLTEVLRDQWGFDGFVVADYGAVTFLHTFAGAAHDGVEASAKAFHAGLDVELPAPVEYPVGLPAALDRGHGHDRRHRPRGRGCSPPSSRVGIFERPYVDADAVVMERPRVHWPPRK